MNEEEKKRDFWKGIGILCWLITAILMLATELGRLI